MGSIHPLLFLTRWSTRVSLRPFRQNYFRRFLIETGCDEAPGPPLMAWWSLHTLPRNEIPPFDSKRKHNALRGDWIMMHPCLEDEGAEAFLFLKPFAPQAPEKERRLCFWKGIRVLFLGKLRRKRSCWELFARLCCTTHRCFTFENSPAEHCETTL